MSSKESVRKNITIRGIDSKTYNDFSHKMKLLNKTMGEALSELMKTVVEAKQEDTKLSTNLFLKTSKLPVINISHYDNLIISESDLIEANSRIDFSHIGELKLESPISKDCFEKYISNISFCNVVVIPKGLPKLIVYSKINHCKSIQEE